MASSKVNVAILFPIGAVVAYGGDLSETNNKNQLKAQGWLLCDGTSYAQSEYSLLFAAIGTANGGDNINFNVPDLRDRFLRGRAGDKAERDPDAEGRIAAAPGGAKGNNVGSLEPSATSLPNANWELLPKGSHSHTIKHIGGSNDAAWSGDNHKTTKDEGFVNTNADGNHFHEILGFDQKTIPVNMSLYYIIKADEPQPSSGTTPTGTIIAFSGQDLSMDAWKICTGASVKKSENSDLAGIIRTNFGGDETNFNLPDMRGYFLRATNNNSTRDPDAAKRWSLLTGGNIGDNIGSVQSFATSNPTGQLSTSLAGKHTHGITDVPKEKIDLGGWASGAASSSCYQWTDNDNTSTTEGLHSHLVIGGDKETRPENIYADFFIALTNLPSSAPPIGSVMSFGGNIDDPFIRQMLMNAGWLPCIQTELRIKDYQLLYDVIKETFGKGSLKSPYEKNPEEGYFFSLPDLRGLFIRGAGESKVGTILGKSNTGVPVAKIITTNDGVHSHLMGKVPTGTVGTNDVHWIWQTSFAKANPDVSNTSEYDNHKHEIGAGGDKESRPINVYVNYIIRYK